MGNTGVDSDSDNHRQVKKKTVTAANKQLEEIEIEDIAMTQRDCLTRIDASVDKLQKSAGESDFCKDYHGLNKLKVELGLVKTFLLCARKLKFSFSSLEDSVLQEAGHFDSLFPEDGVGLPPLGAESRFRETLLGFSQQIRDAYLWMLESMLQSVYQSGIPGNKRDLEPPRFLKLHREIDWTNKRYPSMLDRLLEKTYSKYSDFMEFFHSLLENLENILFWGETCDSRTATLLEPLHQKLVILTDFIRFVRAKDNDEAKCEFMKHCAVLAVSAAHLCFVCWFYGDDDEVLDGMIMYTSESIQKIKPVTDQARLAYSVVRESGSSSATLSTNTIESIGSILDFCKDDHGLNELKVELRLVKTFFLCASKLCHPSNTRLLEASINQNGKRFYSLLLGLKDGLLRCKLAGEASNFRETLKDFRDKISKLYAGMSDSLSVSQSRPILNTRNFEPSWRGDWINYIQTCKPGPNMFDSLLLSSSSHRDEFMEFFCSLLENLVDIVIWGETFDSRLEKLLEPLQEKFVFLKNFILFASLQGKPKRKLMEHCGVVALSAAHLCYICWFFRYDSQELDRMDLKISELIEKINPVAHQAWLAYISVLESGSSSLTLSTETDMFVVGDYVESLLGNLRELLLNYHDRLIISLQHQMRILYEGLQFLRNILKKQQEKYEGLPGRIKDLIGIVVNDAAIVVFSLYQNDIQEASAEEIDVKLFCLLEKVRLIKAEVEGKYHGPLRFNFPTTTVVVLIDLLQEKLKELATCKVDPVFSFAEDRVYFLRSYLKKTVEYPTRYLKEYSPSGENNIEQHRQDGNLQPQLMQEDFLFLRSFLESSLEQHIENKKLQLRTMQDGFVILRSLLLNNREQCNHHEELQALTSHIMEVAHKAEFVIDSLIVGDISFYTLMLFDNVTAEIKLLKIKTSQFDGIKVQKHTNTSRDVPSQAGSKWNGALHQVQDSISAINKVVVDLKDQEQAIINQLLGGSMQLEAISIVGMPGLGKTFLAQRVYKDPSVTSHFHILAWCCISQVYCKKDLLLEILACIDAKAQHTEIDEDDLAHKLCNHLRKQKYLIVLDDVWDIEAWNTLKLSFPDYTNGSRILLTSRHHGIIGKSHHLRPLDEEESWELLQKKLLITGEGYPPELNVLGRQIAKNCNGLPLSIVIISGILGTLDHGRWEEVAERLNLNNKIGDTEQCKSILELSYKHLPDHLKPCLIYFGAFREDQEISVKRLMWMWIAEGFVEKKETESLEKIAEGYIMALINRSLVMEGQQRSIGGVKTCRIHDLLHLLCMEKAKDQNFLHLMRGYDEFLNFDEPHHLRRLSIHCQPKHFVKLRIFCPHVRSLLHSTYGAGRTKLSCNLSFVFHLKLLQVLDLELINFGLTFPSQLGLLVLLKYLAVSGWIKDSLSSLENLSNLETILLRTYHSDSFILQDIFWKMQKLRHVHVHGALIDLRLGNDTLESSSILYNLDTFSTPKLYLGQSMEKLMIKFPNIRRLKCCLLQAEESTGDSTRIVAMDSLSQLESLKLLLGKVTAHPIEFRLPSNLKKLTLEDFSWSIIFTIRKLPNLEVLKLLRQVDGEEEWDMGDVEEMEEEEFFPKLKFLKLESLKLVRWMGSGDHFPSLQRLILEGCVELDELPCCLWETLTLQLIEVHGCLYSAGDLVRDVKKQQMDYGNKDLKILISDEVEESSSWSDGD